MRLNWNGVNLENGKRCVQNTCAPLSRKSYLAKQLYYGYTNWTDLNKDLANYSSSLIVSSESGRRRPNQV